MNLSDFIKKKIIAEFDSQQIDMSVSNSVPNNTISALENPTYNSVNDNAFYFEMKNPDTGLRYDIPMLSIHDPEYFFKYVYYMKLKETSEETFNKIIGWE